MKLEIVKGATARIRATVYTDDGITVANLTGATLTAIFKKNARDLDADALFTVVPAILNAGDGTIEGTIAASQTNDLSYPVLYFELVAKLSDGSFIRSGVVEMALVPIALKTLF